MDKLTLFENDVIPIVQVKKKYENFTIKEIGGPAEIIAWRAEQARKEAANQAVRLQLVESKKERMFGPDAPQGDGVTWNGSVDLSTKSWAHKFEEAQHMKDNFMKPEMINSNVGAHEKYKVLPEPKKSLKQRFKKWIVSIWESATRNL